MYTCGILGVVVSGAGFRSDIQGIRALAVLAVVIFHINPLLLPGGFLGVDFFFVISGYLIIGSTIQSLQAGNFSLKSFYAKRLARLYPALFATLIISAVVAYFLLLPQETESFFKSVVASLFYVSNLFFYSNSGYFDTSSELLPLLHTWSLSVEEQFYVVLPLFLCGLAWWWRRFTPKWLLGQLLTGGLLALFVLSFVLSEWLAYVDTSLAFYFAPSRFWQFIAGGFLAVYGHKIPLNRIGSDVLGAASLVAVAGMLFFYDKNSQAVGVNALLPTLSMVALIKAGEAGGYIHRLMSLKPAQFIGNISYSVYLVHWPIIVFYRMAYSDSFTAAEQLVALVVCLGVGFVSYRFFEHPWWRKLALRAPFRVLVSAGTATVLVMALSLVGWKGLPGRYTESQLSFANYLGYHNDLQVKPDHTCFLTRDIPDFANYEKDKCIKHREGGRNTLLIGDSHAHHWHVAFANFFGKAGFTEATATRCKPLGDFAGDRYCTELMTWIFDDLIKQYRFDQIFVSLRWEMPDIAHVQGLIQSLSPYTDRVIIMGPTLEYGVPLPRLLGRGYTDDQLAERNRYQEIKATDEALKKQAQGAGAEYYSVVDTLCRSKSSCMSVIDGVPVTFDYGHLTHTAAVALFQKIITQWRITTLEIDDDAL